MVYRRGELSKPPLTATRHIKSRSRPTAAPAANYVTTHLFCDSERFSLCPRGHFFYRNGADMNVFGFAKREHAERFGGEFIDPKDRPKWPGSKR